MRSFIKILIISLLVLACEKEDSSGSSDSGTNPEPQRPSQKGIEIKVSLSKETNGDLYNITKKEKDNKAKFVLFIEPDMIFGKDQLKILKLELTLKFWLRNITTKQIETWKFNKDNIDNFRIPLRKRRAGPVLWHINRSKEIQTEFSGCSSNKKK